MLNYTVTQELAFYQPPETILENALADIFRFSVWFHVANMMCSFGTFPGKPASFPKIRAGTPGPGMLWPDMACDGLTGDRPDNFPLPFGAGLL